MDNKTCPQCGAPVPDNAAACKYCGETFQQQATQQAQQTNYYQAQYQPTPDSGINPAWPIKNKIAAGILAIFLGGIGIHKFYLGKIGTGVVYLLFCWTGIPALVGFIEGILYLCSNDHNFQVKHQVRLE